jgi:DNA-binding transcriptional regulator YdaS (Cro superfamily)
MEQALTKAIELAGGPAALGRLLNISSQAVSQWRRVPAERVLEVERATADPGTQAPRVTRHELRPDLYPTGEDSLASH